MARRLTLEGNNTLLIQDHLSGSQLEIYYRLPTTQERTNYTNMSVTRKNGKVKFQHSEARMKFGAEIITGFRDGDFEVAVNDGFKPISSDPNSPNYQPDWKARIKDVAPDIIELLALRVFEASVAVGEPDEPDVDDKDTTDQD